MPNPPFVHLHVHSHYSLLDGLGKVPELVALAKEQGATALALTDHGVLYGAIEFYQECKKQGIKPIIGVEAYIANGKLTDRTRVIGESGSYHIILLAKNLVGYRNLIKLVSVAHLEGYYYKPRIDKELLAKHSEGLIAASACLGGEISRHILAKKEDRVLKAINEYKEIFGKDHFYLELQHHPAIPEQQIVNDRIIELAKEHDLPLIATNDTHYARPDDHDSHDLLVCIQTGRLVSDADRMRYTGDFSLKEPSELLKAFPDHPEALSNTVKIAEMIDLEIPLEQSLLPTFPLENGETEEHRLRAMCEEGLAKRYTEVTDVIRQRLDYELDTVLKMGFPGYFLIVADMVSFAKEKGIFVGPGRGSAAGSLIAYLLGITDIDPLRYDLLFERFLNPDRISMPDIDVDYEDTRRGEVIEHLKDKYGDDHVAGIITFGTIMARAAIRDAGRVLGVPYGDVDRVAKAVPPPAQGIHIPLSKSVVEDPELKKIYKQDPEAKQLLDWAIKLEGTIRHASQHACAIVISKDPLEMHAPVQPSQGGDVHQVTQYSMGPIEKIGLLKMDLLGLANLTIMRRACEIIEAVYDTKVDIYNLPLEDEKTFKLFARGETTGIFQVESAGMKRYLKELQPSRIEDIITMVALYRPGPMQWIDSFINRKRGREEVTYMHPLTESSLKETYGIPVYQEQVMQLSKDMCGFTGGQADTLRKAMGKKIAKLMNQMKELFIEGAVKNGVGEETAKNIFKQLEDFAAYGFNKSHAACYAMIAYQTAYLKAHFPDCFMAALMTSDLDDLDRLSIEISESESMGLKVFPPDLNESFADFAVVKDKKSIRFGLAAIKNVGEGVAKLIVKERKDNGTFKDLEDFLERCSEFLNKKVLENLIKSGSLDTFKERNTLFHSLDSIVKFTSELAKSKSANQMNIFGEQSEDNSLSRVPLLTAPEDKKQYLIWEKELLGLYLSDHPLKTYEALLQKIKTAKIAELTPTMVGQSVRLAVIPISFKKITTRNNQNMAFAEIEDVSGKSEAVLFPTVYNETQAVWQSGQPLLVQGKINDKDGAIKILVDRVWPLEKVKPEELGELKSQPMKGARKSPADKEAETPAKDAIHNDKFYYIDLPNRVAKETLGKIKIVLERHKGKAKVVLRIGQESSTKEVVTKQTVKPSVELDNEIKEAIQS